MQELPEVALQHRELVPPVSEVHLFAHRVTLQLVAQELTDGGHPEAATVDAKQGELRGLSYVLEERVVTYRDEIAEALKREQTLDTKLKEFNSKHAHITSWCDTVRRMCDAVGERDRHNKHTSMRSRKEGGW